MTCLLTPAGGGGSVVTGSSPTGRVLTLTQAGLPGPQRLIVQSPSAAKQLAGACHSCSATVNVTLGLY